MKGIIRTGDMHSGGGTVLSGSTTMTFEGRGAARLGDPVSCPLPGHGQNVIAEAHPLFRGHGIPVAFDGHHCACGCVLISSLLHVKAE